MTEKVEKDLRNVEEIDQMIPEDTKEMEEIMIPDT